MAAGDLLDSSTPLKKQVEIQGLLTGDGTDFIIVPPGISGLGTPSSTKTADAELDGTDGAYASPDRMPVRILLFPYQVLNPDDPDEAMVRALDLATAWEPVTADVELHLQLRGWGHVYFTGRPRGCPLDLERIDEGSITGIAEFHALNPRMQRP